ncbi:zona pellucida-like domain protein [Teladorsagia circumcincta]|uniref:Zona pellucida-like domain protein n=1 Tax=Teladorsagia circumcincta TaxID=45464 RepID=A0A2G9UQL6_TELCI|nr:zona pellucida-like domain protein [Teladorsagia circumcincta]
MVTYWLLLICSFSIQRLAHAIPVPNGQLGRIFVIGRANDSNCFSRDIGRRTTSILIDKDKCGVVTTRSTDPPGLVSNVKIMISFHNDFITKVDRGYEISCLYMQADKTVTYPLTVATQEIAGITELAEMPRCRYEVIDPDTKEAVDVVTVGSKLLHRWTCDSTSPDFWCMTVHSCHVEDGSGTTFTILDDKGCSIDRYLLDNLEYGPGKLQAQKEAHAFKFADKVVVNFQCSVRLDLRGETECPIPACEDPIRFERRLRPRSAGFIHEIPIFDANGSVEVDVRAQQIDVLDPQIGKYEMNLAQQPRLTYYPFRLRFRCRRQAYPIGPDKKEKLKKGEWIILPYEERVIKILSSSSIFSKPFSYEDAKRYCEEHNGRLATLRSKKDAEHLGRSLKMAWHSPDFDGYNYILTGYVSKYKDVWVDANEYTQCLVIVTYEHASFKVQVHECLSMPNDYYMYVACER